MGENFSFRTLMMYIFLVNGIGFIARAFLEILENGSNPFVLVFILGAIGFFIISFCFKRGLKKSEKIDDEFKKLDEERRKEVEKAYHESIKNQQEQRK